MPIMPANRPAVKPPSAGSATPLIKEAAALFRKTSASACSRADDRRPIGCVDQSTEAGDALAKWSVIIGVSVGPGSRQLIRMPRLMSDWDWTIVQTINASFEKP